MTGRDFLSLAHQLAAAGTEAAWRTAVSRAYYAAFHYAREFLEDLSFTVPRADLAHKYLIFRLSNCGDVQVEQAAHDLDILRGLRNQADYELRRPFHQGIIPAEVQRAERIIQILDAVQDPRKTQITDAIKIYERDVLKNVTWHP
jgi:hypothetical protein